MAAAAAAAILGVAAATAGVVRGRAADDASRSAPKASIRPVTIELDGRALTRTTARPTDTVVPAASAQRRLAARLPSRASRRQGRVLLRYRIDRAATARRALAARAGRVEAVASVERSVIAAPVLRQAQRNSCETAALSILLASVGTRVAQTTLQNELPRSGPLDPATAADGTTRVWGDPDRGYVGRVDGGGTAGGFGVYPAPIRALAATKDVQLQDLTGRSPSAVYARLRQGRAVMAWVGLSDGPYGEWTSPAGKAIRANFGEHTVVLHGVDRDNAVKVSNPLQGTAETWSAAKFETMWERLGRRALSA